LREAAAFLAGRGGAGSTPTAPDASRDGSPQPQQREGLRPLDHLQPEHEAVQALGVSPETAKRFGAGYAPKGILRGRLAIPIHDRAGVLIAYCGRAVREEEPKLIFPNGFDPASVILNAHRITAGDLALVRDPLHVLTACESGIENVVALLTATANAAQLSALAALMQEKQCETLDIH
jgi:hypothetical protein